MIAVIEINTGLMKLIQISNILNNEFVQDPIDVSEIYWDKYKYAPFSDHFPRIHQLTPSNLEKMIVIFCNSNYNMSQ